MNNPQYILGVPQGTAAMTAVEQKFPRCKIKYHSSLHDGFLAVKYGKIDAFAFDRHTLQYVLLHNPDLTLMDEKIADEHIVVGTAPGRNDLIAKVNAFIKQYRADGTFRDMYDRWFLGKSHKMPDLPEPRHPTMTLKIGTDGTNEPMNFYKEGQLTGFDIEFAKRLALFLNARITFHTIEFPAIIIAATTGKIDLLIASLNVTPERSSKMLFSDTYIDSEISFLVRRDRLAGGKVVVVAAGTDGAKGGKYISVWRGLKNSFLRTFVIEDRYKMVFRGLSVTLLITVFAAILGTLLGFGVCMMRRSESRWANLPAKAFIGSIQGTPIIVLLMILYYVVFGNVDVNGVLVAILGFSINFAAYVSEMMRTGIDAVDKGQHEAAYALGFNRLQVFAKITFPQAAIQVLPVFRGEFISMLKMTSIVGYIAIQDLTKVSDIIRSRTYEAFFPLIATALIYFVIAYAMAWMLSLVEMKVDPKRRKREVKGVVTP